MDVRLVLLASTAAVFLVVAVFLSGTARARALFAYRVTGGLAGLDREYVFCEDGGVLLRDLKLGQERRIQLDPESLGLVHGIYELLKTLPDTSVQAKQGAADFFTYSLDFDGRRLEWVDPGVASSRVPGGLLSAHRLLAALVEDKVSGTSATYQVAVREGPVELRVELPRYYAKVGEPLTLRVAVANVGSSTLAYYAPTPCDPDVSVSSDLSSSITFVEPAQRDVCAQVLQERRLDPGGVVENTLTVVFHEGGLARLEVTFPRTAPGSVHASATVLVHVRS
ncbi:hypothetical protein IG193_00655 [Infirmifilum lucidum]|uniref:Intracellular proteinase inhibitor BsuPI domain-containing protein n=1 Tax=Infirmifilum lucidum TaxID=2776706 RepID=A0A7L9FH93_9CREN|nr:hypothetical protein [Infirmifilum lucidum]QOJ79011.1 hypothetical protein IG193_00655 [Infirmifilum lucidum]